MILESVHLSTVLAIPQYFLVPESVLESKLVTDRRAMERSLSQAQGS
jgi:hypothetical protein